jgi:BlaI family transcriptional regulator, penicillinase repressor
MCNLSTGAAVTKISTVTISAAESLVMEVIWESHPILTENVVAALALHESWQEPTVKTLLNRLLKKGAISARKDGRRYLYSPVLKREHWLAAESKGFLDRLFGGRVAPLVSHFSQQKRLSRKDIADLKRLIQELDDGK